MSETLEAEVRALRDDVRELNERMQRIEQALAILVDRNPPSSIDELTRGSKLRESPSGLDDVL